MPQAMERLLATPRITPRLPCISPCISFGDIGFPVGLDLTSGGTPALCGGKAQTGMPINAVGKNAGGRNSSDIWVLCWERRLRLNTADRSKHDCVSPECRSHDPCAAPLRAGAG